MAAGGQGGEVEREAVDLFARGGRGGRGACAMVGDAGTLPKVLRYVVPCQGAHPRAPRGTDLCDVRPPGSALAAAVGEGFKPLLAVRAGLMARTPPARRARTFDNLFGGRPRSTVVHGSTAAARAHDPHGEHDEREALSAASWSAVERLTAREALAHRGHFHAWGEPPHPLREQRERGREEACRVAETVLPGVR